MITVTKQENGVLFTFQDSNKYLYGSGTIEVPFNSLSIIQDESDMITLRKSASWDIFLAARYDTDLGYRSKEEAVEALKGMLYDEAGISEEEVQEMIDAATSGIPSSQVVEQLRTDVNTISANTYTKTQIDGFLDNATTMLTTISGDVQTNAANIRDINDTIDEKEEVIASALTEVRQDVADIDAKEEVIASALTEVRQDVSAIDAKEEVIASALTEVNLALDNKLDASAYTPTDLSQYWTSAQTQSAIDDAKAYYVDFAAMSVQGITDADWDGLVAAINAHRPILVKVGTANGYVNATTAGIFDNTIIVTGADEGNASKYTFTKNGSNDYSVSISTKKFVSQAEKDRWNAKQDALSAGTGIEISGNVISATGGGGAGLDDDTQQLISTALNDLNDRKADLTELSKYQKKGDYVVTSTLADYMTNDAFDEYATAKERIISGALNDLNNKFGGLRLIKLTQAEYDALATKDSSTLYIISD